MLQLGRELVEVPNVVSQVVKQNVDISVRGGVGRRGDLHESLRRDLALLARAWRSAAGVPAS